ncbi:MAG: YgfZ/GcvT domain-containing protein, partial [Acidimicrobiales bacterium]
APASRAAMGSTAKPCVGGAAPEAVSLAFMADTTWAVRLQRDVVRAAGPDAETFLQGQLSQDVAALGVGQSAWSLLLQPAGKVDAWLRVTRRGADEFALDVDHGWGEGVMARLTRFRLRVKCDLELATAGCVAVRGDVPAADRPDGGLIVVWPGADGFDLLGDAVAVPEDIVERPYDAYEALRIECGVPAMGAELTERTIPAETGQWLIDASVSFTKGCYTGQELVARIDSRGGHVPRRLRGIVVKGPTSPPVGAELRSVEGKVVGELTSVVLSAARGGSIGLGYVGRAVEPPAAVTLAWPGGETEARVEELPLVS